MTENEDLEEIEPTLQIVAAPVGERVAYIHVSEGCEEDLEAQLKGAKNLDIQILEEEALPDIDESDMIHGLDHTGTSRDYVDDRHRCTINCPIGCQGHLRPNEIVIYESFKFEGRLRGRKRYKGRIIYNIRYRDAREHRDRGETSSSNSTGSQGSNRSSNNSSRGSSSSLLSTSTSSSSSSSSSSSRSSAQKARLERRPVRKSQRDSPYDTHARDSGERAQRHRHRDQRSERGQGGEVTRRPGGRGQ